MSRGVPCLGYPSRSEAALSLFESGLRHGQIAVEIGANPSSIGRLVLQGRRIRARRIEQSLDARLRVEARDRGMDPSELRAALFKALLEDQLIDAILDEGART